MRILSFGDVHIGTDCDDDVREATKQIIAKAEETKPDLVIITGDVYDGSSNPEHRLQAAEMVGSLANVCMVYIIKGNHDARRDLELLQKLIARNKIYVYERPDCIELPGGVYLHLLPWLTKSGWIAGKIGIDQSLTDLNTTVSQMALSYLKGVIYDKGPGKHIIFGHLLVAGSRLENHQPLLGEGITFGYHDLVEAGFCTGAFGHIHLAQTFGRTDGSPEFRYNGAVAALNYGEFAGNKTFSILDTDSLTFETFFINTTQRVTFDALWDGALDEEFKAHIRNDVPVAPLRLRVKLLIDEGYSSDDAKKAVQDYISSNLPANCTLKDLKIETQRKPKNLVRAKEIASAKTACQKLEAYWHATFAEPDEPMRSDMLRITSEIEEKLAAK